MKYLILSAGLLATTPLLAQDLAVKIPKDATIVVSGKGNKFLELMSVTEFDNSFLGRKLLEETSGHKKKNTHSSAADFGIKLDGTVYFFNRFTDTISYNCLLLPIADAAKFEQVLKQHDRDRITRNGNLRQLREKGSETLLQWNDEMALLVIGDLKTGFLENDSVLSARYGLKNVSYSDYYYDKPVEAYPSYPEETVAVEAVPATDEQYPYAVEAAPVAVEVDDENYPYAVDTIKAVPEEIAVVISEEADEAVPVLAEPPPVNDEDMIVPPPMYPVEEGPSVIATTEEPVFTAPVADYYDNAAYETAYSQQKIIRDSLTTLWTDHYAALTFNKTTINNSILENPAYLHGQDPDAVASIYLSAIQDIYKGFIPYFSYRYLGMANIMSGYGSLNANLYMDKEQMRITTDMQVDDAKAASIKKVYQHKLNKKFARYINSEKMVGFIGYSFDTEQYLKEFPQLLETSYSSYFGLYQDELSIGAELFSLLLDEKAVAKVIKGDAVLLLNDIGPKEYTYTTYEYDDNYERTEVKKKKTETLPDFLFMMSSDDTQLLERILKYGIRKEQVVLKNGIYTLSGSFTKNSPFGFHILIKDGIIFCGTSYRDIQQIGNDSYQGNMSKEHKKLLLKNNVSMLFNPKNIAGKVSGTEWGSMRRLEDFNTLMNAMGPMYARTTGIKNGHVSGEMIATVSGGKENALKYFFSLVELAARLD